MPLPGFLSRFSFGRSFNNLDSTSSPAQRPQSAHSQSSLEAPPTKRQKTARHSEELLRGPFEEIENSPQNSPIRSQSRIESPSLSASSISSSFQEMSSYGGQDQHIRNDRRRRHRHPSHGSIKSQASADDDINVLKQNYIDPLRQCTTRFGEVKGDAADLVILEGVKGNSLSTPKPVKGRKRLSQEPHEHDELGLGHSPNQGKKRQASSSISHRGDLTPTQFSTKTSRSIVIENRHAEFPPVLVSAAACYEKYLYAATDENTCFLYSKNHDKSLPELCAITEDRKPHPEQRWLKVTSKANTLHHNPDSPYLKVSQSTDTIHQVGPQLIIKFETPADASAVVNWARDNLRAVILEETCKRLLSTWDKICSDVNRKRSAVKAAETGCTPKPPVDHLPWSMSASTSPTQVSPPSKSRTTIRDGMQVSAPATPKPVATYGRRSSRLQGNVSTTRSTKPVELDRSLSPETPPAPRWSEQNKGWIQDWQTPLQFGRVQLTKDDIPRLDEAQYLNDSIIEFGLKYLFEKFEARHPDLKRRVYVHNSFFYTSLTGEEGNKFRYDSVKRWTAKVDLLSHDYVVVPINQHYHWWVAIICNPGKLDPDARQKPKEAATSSDVEMTEAPPVVKSDVVDLATDNKNTGSGRQLRAQPKQRKAVYRRDDPCILLLDSLGSGHVSTVRHLRNYLVAEFQDKRGRILNSKDLPPRLGMRAVDIPQQSNMTDCGIFLLGYMQEFVKDPDTFIEALLSKEKQEWQLSAPDLRSIWRDTIFNEKRLSQPDQQGSLAKDDSTHRNQVTALPINSAKLTISTSQRSTEAVAEAAKPPEDATRATTPPEDATKKLSEQLVTSVEIEPTSVQEAAEHPVGPAEPAKETATDETDNRMELDDSAESPTPEPPKITELATPFWSSMDLVRHQNGLPNPGERSSSKPASSPVRQCSQTDDDVVLIPTPDTTGATQPVVSPKRTQHTNPMFTARLDSSSPIITTNGDGNDDGHIQEVDAESFYKKSSTPQTAVKTKAPQSGRSVALSSPARASHSRHPDASSPTTWSSNSKRPTASSPPSRGSPSHAKRPNGMSSPASRQRPVTTSAATGQPSLYYTSSAFALTRDASVAENLEAVKHHELINIDDSD